MYGRCHISHICEFLLSISGEDHIHHLCKMHFGSCAISHAYQSRRYEKCAYLGLLLTQYCSINQCSSSRDIMHNTHPQLQHQRTHNSMLSLNLFNEIPKGALNGIEKYSGKRMGRLIPVDWPLYVLMSPGATSHKTSLVMRCYCNKGLVFTAKSSLYF